ncbi:MAG: metalloregulator ArsR/SmtB family transcription factor [Chloroflexota bacterium]
MSDDISIWAALAEPKRRQIINLLEEKPRTTSELSEFFDVSRFAVMKHLKVLEQAQLIEVRREGRKRWNILNADLAQLLRTKLVDGNTPSWLTEILGFLPTQKATTLQTNTDPAPLCIEQCLSLEATPDQVFSALMVDIAAWWPQRSLANSQIVLEPFVNGRFYEAFNVAGQGVLYGNVTSIKQDEELRIRCTLELAERVTKTAVFDSFIHIELVPRTAATQLFLSHHFTKGIDEMAYVTGRNFWHNVLNQQLKPFVEKGIPYQHNP